MKKYKSFFSFHEIEGNYSWTFLLSLPLDLNFHKILPFIILNCQYLNKSSNTPDGNTFLGLWLLFTTCHVGSTCWRRICSCLLNIIRKKELNANEKSIFFVSLFRWNVFFFLCFDDWFSNLITNIKIRNIYFSLLLFVLFLFL